VWLTHGNGPQVGRILLQQEAAVEVVHPMPLDVCGAESQGQIGYLLQVTIDYITANSPVDPQVEGRIVGP